MESGLFQAHKSLCSKHLLLKCRCRGIFLPDNDILQQMPGLSQPQRKFLATLFITILVLRGRVNFRHLSRYCDYSERTPQSRGFLPSIPRECCHPVSGMAATLGA